MTGSATGGATGNGYDATGSATGGATGNGYDATGGEDKVDDSMTGATTKEKERLDHSPPLPPLLPPL